MPTNLDSVVTSIVSRFAADMANEIVKAVRRDIASQLGGSHAAANAPKRRGRPPKAAAAPAPARRGRRKGGGRVRRSLAQIAQDDTAILKYVKDHPGSRSEQIAKALGFQKIAMASGLLRLRAAGKVKAKGQRRATKYSA